MKNISIQKKKKMCTGSWLRRDGSFLLRDRAPLIDNNASKVVD